MGPVKETKGIIWDLDGTLIDTESLICEASKKVLAAHGAELTPACVAAGMGKRPLEAWQAVIDTLQLKGVTSQQLYDESEPLLSFRWGEAQMMPGATRLLQHFKASGVPMAVATSTPRSSFNAKMSGHSGQVMRDAFAAVVCGDEVVDGKPAPDCFTAAAAALGVAPQDCLVFEDTPIGVQAGAAANMRVVVVPSLPKSEYPPPDAAAVSGCCQMLSSLLDFWPEEQGLPPCTDAIAGVVPLDPVWRIRGEVVRGFGRGSKELGIPTANLDRGCLHGHLAAAVTGIYGGWASVGRSSSVWPMVMSVGFNPFYGNKEKTCEPWILHKFEDDFYGEELRLVVCFYIRPEADFTSLENLVARIHEDAAVTKAALEHSALAAHCHDDSLRPAAPENPQPENGS